MQYILIIEQDWVKILTHPKPNQAKAWVEVFQWLSITLNDVAYFQHHQSKATLSGYLVQNSRQLVQNWTKRVSFKYNRDRHWAVFNIHYKYKVILLCRFKLLISQSWSLSLVLDPSWPDPSQPVPTRPEPWTNPKSCNNSASRHQIITKFETETPRTFKNTSQSWSRTSAPVQERPASSKPPAMSSIFESVLDAFKLNRF